MEVSLNLTRSAKGHNNHKNLNKTCFLQDFLLVKNCFFLGLLLQNFDLSKNFFCVFCGPVELLEDSGEPLWRVDTSLEKTQKNTTPENERLEPKNHPEM